MANIPGISGPVNPDVFSRDQIRTTGVSLPGGARVLAIIGEGRREETIVSSAVGGGHDGLSPDFSGNASPDGRHFALSNSPVVVNRTSLLLNGIPLNGVEQQINSSSFDSRFDFRIDSALGHIELQGAALVDQGGKFYIRGASNYGDGYLNILEVATKNAPSENWTLRCAGVSRDSYGRPVSATETFTLAGTVSGQIRSSTGAPLVFSIDAYGTDGYYYANWPFIGANPITTQAARSDGYFATPDNSVALGYRPLVPSDTNLTTNLVYSPTGGFLQAAPGDTVTVAVTGTPASTYVAKVTVVHNDKVLETDTPIALTVSNVTAQSSGFTFSATAPAVLHTSSTLWSATVVGKKIRSPFGIDYPVIGLIQEQFYGAPIHTLRLSGIVTNAGPGVQWQTMQSNGIINFAIMEGLQAFDVGDRFDFVVSSRRLNQNDSLVAQYIPQADLNSPVFLSEVQDVYGKFGRPSTTNTLSLGAQLAFTNGAPGMFCVSAAPGLARRMNQTLLEVSDGTAGTGFNGSPTNPSVDSLRLPLPPGAQPDGETDVHIFIQHRDPATGTVSERQIFPNKAPFYNSANAGPVGEQAFVNNNTYSYTMVLDHDILQAGQSGTTDKTKPYNFAAVDAQFSSVDKSNALGVGNVIRLVGGAKADGTRFTSFNDSTIISSTDIANGIVAADGSIALRIANVLSSTTVVFSTGAPIDLTTSAPFATIVGGTFGGFLQNLQSVDWQLIDASQNLVLTSSLLFSKDVVTNGTIQQGDGVRVTYIDRLDAPFFDPNWLLAYESLESFDVQMVCPLPTMTYSSIFRQGVTHVESQSYIQNKHERVLLIGAITGISPDALLGNTEVAVENIGILEGIQGASAADVLEGNIEDLADYSINTNFGNSSRVEYFYPDQVVVNVGGELTALNGFYLSAAAGGWYANNQNIAEPLTNKSLSGFSILSSRQYKPTVLNQLAGIGVTVLQPITGGGNVLWAKTTSNSGFPEDQEASIRFTRDRVQRVLRDGMRGLIGTVETMATPSIMITRVVSILNALVAQGLITSFVDVTVARDSVEPRQWNVFARYSPAYPLDFIFIDLEVGVL